MQHGPGMHAGSMKKKLASYEVGLKHKQRVAEGTYTFTFEKPAGFDFLSGQHIRMTLINPPETDAEGDKRFLTMASTPQESDLVFAMRMRNTAFKRSLSRMQPGEKVLIQKLVGESPRGSFVLHENASQAAVFIAGGIGIVPAYSMIKDAIQRKLPHQLFLFYSNRRPEDAPFLAELQKLAKQNANLTLIATMTETEKSKTGWHGETGHINQAVIEKYVDDTKSPTYYVAGLPAMVSAVKMLLVDMGVHQESIRAEEFTGFDLNKIDNSPGRDRKRYALIAAIAALLLALVLIHSGILSLSHTGLDALSFTNPISYFIIGALLVLVGFKLLVLLKLSRKVRSKQGKLSARTMLEAHKPKNRE